MVFLNPAILFGLLAASIPVLIHLLNLKKLKKIEFSTLSFLKELQKNKIRKLKVKQWILLALRVLIILLLVTAFARPTLEGAAIGGTTSAAKTSAVFILDDTYSMSVIDGDGSYLNQAKETIKELLEQFEEGDEAVLLPVSEKGKGEAEVSQDIKGFLKKVEGVNPSAITGDLNQSIIQAGEILSESDNFNKEIYILSDFQAGRIAGEGEMSDLSEILNSNIKLYTFDYSGKEVFNLGIDELNVNTQIFEEDKPIVFGVTVTNYSERPVSNAVVSLFINGNRSAQQGIDMGAGESRVIEMEALVSETGYIDASVEIEDDEILQDNKRYTSLFIPKEIPVIIFAESDEDTKFIEIALSAAGNEASIKITKRNLNQISSFNLNDFDVVVIAGGEKTGQTGRLLEYTENGGGVLLLPGSATKFEEFGRLLSGLQLVPPAGEAGSKEGVENPVFFGEIEYEHPLFSNIFVKEEQKKIESAEIYYYFRQSTGGAGSSIMTLTDGSVFLSEYRKGKGKILLFNTAPVLSWSNFPIKSIFVPLINKSIFYLASKDLEDQNYEAGETINLPAAEYHSQLRIEQPDGAEEFINREGELNERYVSYKQTRLAGNYYIYSEEELLEVIPVNTNPLESVTKYADESDFEDYLKSIKFNGTHINIDKTEDAARLVLQARFGSELWKIFLIAALILALIEMAVARSAKKDSTEIK